jgi:hypothetical protein
MTDLDPDDGPGEPPSSCRIHRGILPPACAGRASAAERVTRATRVRNTPFLA